MAKNLDARRRAAQGSLALVQQAERVLDRYKPKKDRHRRELELVRENISRRLAEAAELFPSEANLDD